MSAHLRPLADRCAMPGCSKRPTVEAFNNYNTSLGKFCRTHGAMKVRDFNKRERLLSGRNRDGVKTDAV